MPKRIDRTGHKSGRLTVLQYAGKQMCSILWLCKCECGNSCIVTGTNLKTTFSCGCLAREMTIKRNTTHGLSKLPEYRTWKRLKGRCCNPKNQDYPDYGGRGVSVCDRWLNSFESFYADMGNCPQGLSIDRIDVNGKYEPDNCRWATVLEQVDNRRITIWLTFNGETLTRREWAKRLGVTYQTIYERTKRGLPIEQILKPRY